MPPRNAPPATAQRARPAPFHCCMLYLTIVSSSRSRATARRSGALPARERRMTLRSLGGFRADARKWRWRAGIAAGGAWSSPGADGTRARVRRRGRRGAIGAASWPISADRGRRLRARTGTVSAASSLNAARGPPRGGMPTELAQRMTRARCAWRALALCGLAGSAEAGNGLNPLVFGLESNAMAGADLTVSARRLRVEHEPGRPGAAPRPRGRTARDGGAAPNGARRRLRPARDDRQRPRLRRRHRPDEAPARLPDVDYDNRELPSGSGLRARTGSLALHVGLSFGR